MPDRNANANAHNLFSITRRDDAAPQLEVQPGAADPKPIHGRIFGNFLEHLGYAIQGGVQAQLLLNPTLFASPRFPNQNLPAADLAQLRENGVIAERLHRLDAPAQAAFAGWRPHLRVTGFGVMILDDQSAYGIPLPWTASPQGAVSGMQPGRIGPSVRLAPAGGEALLAQGVFPPHERELTYVGHLWVKVAGDVALRVELRRRLGPAGQEVLAAALLPPCTDAGWCKCAFELTLPAGSLRPLEPVDFCIVAAGSGLVWVDQARLLPADHVDGLDPDMLVQIRSLAPPLLRWPGGNFTSTYHFYEGIGALDERQTVPNLDWGGIEDNSFGINEFLRLCELVQTEPHLCVNMGSGTAEEAAAWVEYVNGPATSHWGARRAADGRPEPYGVRLWEIGNEIYGVWQTGHCGSEENARRHRIWAEAMLAVDPTLELIATGNHADFTEPHHHWHETLLRDGGPHVGSIALHALPGNTKQLDQHSDLVALWQQLMAHPHRWERVDLPALRALAQQLVPARAVDIAITEWGILGETQRPQVGNLGGAVYAALFLNMAIRMHEHVRVANATALLHGGALRRAGPFHYEDPQVDVIRRYTTLQDGVRLPIAYVGPAYDVDTAASDMGIIADVPWLDAVAVRLLGGTVTIAVVNRHAHKALDFSVRFAGGATFSPRTFEVMTGHMRAMNTPIAPQRVAFVAQPLPEAGNELTLQLPPRAIGWLQGVITA